jgi:hypothetical protein
MFVLNAHVSFMEPTERVRAEVDAPDAIVDFFRAYILLDVLKMLRISPPPART